MKHRIKLFLMVIFCALGMIAQNKETKTEEDGYVWVLIEDGDFIGAETITGKTLIPLSEKYTFVKYMNGLFYANDFDKYEMDEDYSIISSYEAYYSTDGLCLIRPKQYDSIAFEESAEGIPAYFIVKKNGKYGVCDAMGRLILEPIAKYYPTYTESGFVVFDMNGDELETGVVLQGADTVAMAKKTEIKESDGYVWIKMKSRKGKYGAYDRNQNSLILPIVFDRLEYQASKTSNSSGLFIGKLGNSIGWYATNGFAFVPIEEGYDYIRPANFGNYTIVYRGEKRKGVYEPSLGEIIPCGKYDDVYYKKNGYFEIVKNGKYGVADIYGNEIVPTLYSPLLNRDEKGVFDINDEGDYEYVYTGVFPETKECVLNRFEKALKTKDNNEAIDLYRNVILADPIGRYVSISNCYNNMGVAYNRNKDISNARYCFQKALELDADNDLAKTNLDAVSADQGQTEENINFLDVVFNVVDVLNTGVNTYNAYSKSETYSPKEGSSNKKRNNGEKQSKTKKIERGRGLSKTVNERVGRDTYNNYVSQLIDMSTYPSRYNDSQRRSIQSSMKSIRQRHGFAKSAWEDWNGKLNETPK